MNDRFDYAGPFGATYHQARRLPREAERWICRVRAAKIQKWIGKEDSVLEYGVGFGWNLADVRCREKVGFDVADVREDVESRGIRFFNDENSLPRSAFDVLLAHHALEHLPNPADSLVRWRLASRLITFVPLEREMKYRRYRLADRAHHLYGWTPSSLGSLLARSGWIVQEIAVNKFRFDRIAAKVAFKARGGWPLFWLLRTAGLFLMPEYEIRAIARAA
jgi:hypothetical protein